MSKEEIVSINPLSHNSIKETEEKLYTINEIASFLNVHQQTLRNWERKNLITPLRVGARRIYSKEKLELCKKIKSLSQKGFSLKVIKEILNNMQ